MQQSESNAEVWTNCFDVVILPPPAVRNYAIELSRRLARYESKFVLGKRRYIPHISLYHIPVKPENFNSFSLEVQRIARALTPAKLRISGLQPPWLTIDRPEWLVKLHWDIVRRTYKFFDWEYGAEDSWNIAQFPERARGRAAKYLEKYGSPFVGAAFKPHITLTSFADKRVADEIPRMSFRALGIAVDAIQICELGPSHSCQRVVARFRI